MDPKLQELIDALDAAARAEYSKTRKHRPRPLERDLKRVLPPPPPGYIWVLEPPSDDGLRDSSVNRSIAQNAKS
jgi:hypothetical protein